ncbi:MAG: peptidoglycan-binding protein, partial [Kiloniellaceae bacterium]
MIGNWRQGIGILGLAALGWATAAAPGRAELSVQQVAEMERLLARLNFDPGQIDGVVDERTRTAIRLYQEFAALPTDGQPSKALLAELRSVVQAFADLKATRGAEAAPGVEREVPPQAAAPTPEAAPAPEEEVPPQAAAPTP